MNGWLIRTNGWLKGLLLVGLLAQVNGVEAKWWTRSHVQFEEGEQATFRRYFDDLKDGLQSWQNIQVNDEGRVVSLGPDYAPETVEGSVDQLGKTICIGDSLLNAYKKALAGVRAKLPRLQELRGSSDLCRDLETKDEISAWIDLVHRAESFIVDQIQFLQQLADMLEGEEVTTVQPKGSKIRTLFKWGTVIGVSAGAGFVAGYDVGKNPKRH